MLFFPSLAIMILRRKKSGDDIKMKNMRGFLKPINLNCFNSRWSLWEWTVEFLLTGK